VFPLRTYALYFTAAPGCACAWECASPPPAGAPRPGEEGAEEEGPEEALELLKELGGWGPLEGEWAREAEEWREERGEAAPDPGAEDEGLRGAPGIPTGS